MGTRARFPRVSSYWDSGKTQAGNHMGLRPRDVKRLFISNFRFNCQHWMSFWFKRSREMSHKAYNLQLLIIYSQFSVLSGNVCRKDNFHHLPPSLSTGTPQKKKSSSRASSKTTQGWKSSRTSPNLFHFQISLPTYFQECLRSIVVQYPCHKSLHLHFSKRLKSLLYFPASLTVLQSIQDVERRVN